MRHLPVKPTNGTGELLCSKSPTSICHSATSSSPIPSFGRRYSLSVLSTKATFTTNFILLFDTFFATNDTVVTDITLTDESYRRVLLGYSIESPYSGDNTREQRRGKNQQHVTCRPWNSFDPTNVPSQSFLHLLVFTVPERRTKFIL